MIASHRTTVAGHLAPSQQYQFAEPPFASGRTAATRYPALKLQHHSLSERGTPDHVVVVVAAENFDARAGNLSLGARPGKPPSSPLLPPKWLQLLLGKPPE